MHVVFPISGQGFKSKMKMNQGPYTHNLKGMSSETTQGTKYAAFSTETTQHFCFYHIKYTPNEKLINKKQLLTKIAAQQTFYTSYKNTVKYMFRIN